MNESHLQSTATVPRPEYPRPTLVRERWLNLNGEWQFAMDPSDVGLQERWQQRSSLGGRIIVPFCVESDASNSNTTAAASATANVVWYCRTFECPEQWGAESVNGERLLLHIGAADYATRVFINGLEVGQNQGGYAPFSVDISHALAAGVNRLTVRCEDSASWSQPRGKQEGTTRWPIDYDSVTGIWQTVWLEPVPATAICEMHSDYKVQSQTLRFFAGVNRLFTGRLQITIAHGDEVLADIETEVQQRAEIKSTIQFSSVPSSSNENPLPLWSPNSPELCDVRLRLFDQAGLVVDEVSSYLGLREISVEAGLLRLNGEPLYTRGVLDQGYFPGGWYSAVDDSDYQRDIELTKAMGFNCVRKHQKAEDPRYLYWADRLGLLVWAEMPSGRIFSSDLVSSLTSEWMRLVRRDRVHPCVIAWVPFNESWGVWNQVDRPEQRAFVEALTSLTRALDTSRLVIGNDGWEYAAGDLWTLHLYEGDAKPLAERLSQVLSNPGSPLQKDGRVGALEGAKVDGLPVLLTECGGVGYDAAKRESDVFSYGDLPTTAAELKRRIRAVMESIDKASTLQGFVWTQLTDVQQEMNGLLSFEREPKLPLSVLRAVFSADD